jgi:altronate dehydratase large subunit
MSGFRRSDGSVGCRNHVLVLPSVVCSGLVAQRIAGGVATALVHQHGCDHVGDDATQTGRVLAGLATNPNVAAALVVGLGCETLQGRALVEMAEALGRRVELIEIQERGGSANAIEFGQGLVEGMVADVMQAKERAQIAEFTLGIAVDDWSAWTGPLEALAQRASSAGARLVAALPGTLGPTAGIWREALRIRYGERPSAPMSITLRGGRGAEQHTGLAASGAQVVISLRPPLGAPIGFPLCPVVAVAGDARTYSALSVDFDMDGSSHGPDALGDMLWSMAQEVFNGELTASERRGAREFALQRISRST